MHTLDTPSISSGGPDQLAQARDLVLAHGWNATAYQIVNPGMSLWFSARGDAVVGYVERRLTRVVAGAPVCAPDRLVDVVDEFEQECKMKRRRVLYFGAEARLESVLRGRADHARVLLGSQPSWNPPSQRAPSSSTTPSIRRSPSPSTQVLSA